MAASAEPVVDVDATEIDEKDDITPPPADEPSTALAVVAPGAGQIIRAEQPDEILHKAGVIATSLKKLLEDQGLAVDVGGRRKHVEVGGWQALGVMLGALGGTPLHAETVWTRKIVDPGSGDPVRTTYTATVKRYHRKDQGGGLREEITYDVDGYDWEACVEIRTPDGVVVGKAEAMVSRAEQQWSRSDDYAVRSMAETRAESRAFRRAAGWIVHLAGYSPTPAEEMGHQPGTDAQTAPGWAVPAPDEIKKSAISWLAFVFEQHRIEEPRKAAIAIGAEIAKLAGGTLPDIAAKAIILAGKRVDEAVKASTPATDDAPADTTGADETPPAETPVDETPPAGTIVVDGSQHADHVRKAGDEVAIARIVSLDRAREICTCPGGYDEASRQGTPVDDACPIFDHGIPF